MKYIWVFIFLFSQGAWSVGENRVETGQGELPEDFYGDNEIGNQFDQISEGDVQRVWEERRQAEWERFFEDVRRTSGEIGMVPIKQI